MNIAQLSEQLKDVPQNRLIDYARNPNSVVPQFLALAEIQRRQHLSAQVAPPATTVAEEVLAQAQPAPQMAQMAQQLPENQPGVAQLQSGMGQGFAPGGLVAFADGGLSDEEEDDKETARLFPKSSLSDFQEMLSAIPSGVRSLVEKLPKSYEETKLKQATMQPNKRGGHKYEDAVIKEAQRQGIDPNLALHVLYKETGNLKDPESARSRAGALGVMQLMPATAKELGVNPLDPHENIRGGIGYLKKMYDRYGDARTAAAAYNAGPGNVDKALRRAGGLDTLHRETRNYIAGLAQGGAIKGYSGADDESLVGVSEDEARSPFAFLNPSDIWSGIKNYAMSNWEKNKALREGKVTPAMVRDATAKDELERERSRGIATANVNKRDIAAGNLQTPVIANQVPSAQDFRDFDQAAALFQAENANASSEQQAPAKSKAELYAEALEQDIQARAAKAKEDAAMNAYLALMQAGLGMMASKSPYALGGIGEGGQQGLSTYAALRKQQADEEKDIMATRLGLYKYGAASEQAAADIALKNKMLARKDEQYEESLGLKRTEAEQRRIALARDDLRQYEQMKLKALESRFPVPMPKDPNYQAALQSIYNSPEYKEMYMLAFPNLARVQQTQSSAPATGGWSIKPKQ